MRTIKDDEVTKRDCLLCTDYRSKLVRAKAYAFRLNVCKFNEGCPYAAAMAENEDKIRVNKG